MRLLRPLAVICWLLVSALVLVSADSLRVYLISKSVSQDGLGLQVLCYSVASALAIVVYIAANFCIFRISALSRRLWSFIPVTLWSLAAWLSVMMIWDQVIMDVGDVFRAIFVAAWAVLGLLGILGFIRNWRSLAKRLRGELICVYVMLVLSGCMSSVLLVSFGYKSWADHFTLAIGF